MAKVLVVDDERMIRWSIQQTLSAAGHEVTACDTATEGMALFEWLRPDVVLLDLRLPDGSGETILKTIKAGIRGDTAVIMMTAFEEDCTPEHAKALGAFEYLRKPFDFNELCAIVSRAVEAHQQFELPTADREASHRGAAGSIFRPKS